MFTTAHQIPLGEWVRRLVVNNCITISARFWPIHDPQAREYRCKVGDFLTQPTYLVRFTSPDRCGAPATIGTEEWCRERCQLTLRDRNVLACCLNNDPNLGGCRGGVGAVLNPNPGSQCKNM
jgi:hypothetical protein